jgi:hypothetical protein
MKKIIFTVAGLFITAVIFSQSLSATTSAPGKIKLVNGQKIMVETKLIIEAGLGMGMELNSTSTNQNLLEVKNSTAGNYTISNTLTKMKLDMNMMGQPTSYDSEKKGSNSDDMAKIFDERMNKPTDIIIDNKTGLAITENKKVKKADTENANPADDLMKMFGDISDDAVVSAAFEMIPTGKKIGDSWSDTLTMKDSKTIRNYTFKSVTGNDAVLLLDIVSTATNKMEFQEMEFEIKSTTKTTGEILTDLNTSLVKQKTTTSDITGSFQMMGQDMPISAKVSSSSIYK